MNDSYSSFGDTRTDVAPHAGARDAGQRLDSRRDRVRFTLSAGTAVKFGFFAALGVFAFYLILGVVFAIVTLVVAAAGFITLPLPFISR